MSRIDRMSVTFIHFGKTFLFLTFLFLFSFTCICCALFRVIARFFYLKLSLYCVSFRVFIFFYESIDPLRLSIFLLAVDFILYVPFFVYNLCLFIL